jgi:hypothetical protein
VGHKTAIKHEIRVLESHTSVQQEEVNLRLVPNGTNHLEKCLFGFQDKCYLIHEHSDKPLL